MAEMIEGGFGGRLALREQGKWWVCYWAKPDTMDGATEVARVRLSLVVDQPLLKQQFINFCKEGFAVAARESLGTDPLWPRPPMPAKD